MKTAKTCPNCRRRTMGSASKGGAFCRNDECGWMSVSARIESERTKAKRDALATWEARKRELERAIVEAAMAWYEHGHEPAAIRACAACLAGLAEHEAAKPGQS